MYKPISNCPTVSIIMPLYNAYETIEVAISSVIKQSLEDWELLVCDDGSTDNSLTVVQNYQFEDSRISIISNKYAKGAAGARNSALDIAKGRYVAFLDSDDEWLSEKLELQIDFMRKNNYSFTFSYYETMSEKGDLLLKYKAPEFVDGNLMKLSNFIPCLTAVYDSHVIGKIYQPVFKKRNDFALWLKILNDGEVSRAYCLPVITARYRVNQHGLSSNKLDNLLYFRRCLTEYGNCNLFEANIYACIYLFVTLIKKRLSCIYNFIVVKI